MKMGRRGKSVLGHGHLEIAHFPEAFPLLEAFAAAGGIAFPGTAVRD